MTTRSKVALPKPSPKSGLGGVRLNVWAYTYLKGLLLDGGLEPGDRLSAESVSKVLSVSRAPVSDAIRRLAMEGLLEIVPQVGCQVTTPNPEEVRDFYEVFGAAEGAILRLAAIRRSPAEAENLGRLAAEWSDTDDLPGDPAARAAELRDRNRRRYKQLHQLANSPLSTGLAESFWDRSDFYIRSAFQGQPTPDYVRAAHHAIVNAVIEQDAEAAENATRTYLRKLGQDVADLLSSKAAT